MAKIKIKTNNGFSEIATVDYVDTQILSSKGTPAESVANFLTITKNNTDIYYNGGAMRKVSVPTIHYGTSVPSDDIGQDGDLFIIVQLPTITFYIGSNSFTANEGMTWLQWINSDYNTIGAFTNANTDGDRVVYTDGSNRRFICETRSPQDKFAYATDIIISEHTYDNSYKYPLEPGEY